MMLCYTFTVTCNRSCDVRWNCGLELAWQQRRNMLPQKQQYLLCVFFVDVEFNLVYFEFYVKLLC